jgi:TP901 family phage tail tape measure protein
MADQSLLINVGANISNLTNGLQQASNQVSSFVRDTQRGFEAIGRLGAGMTAVGVGLAVGLTGAVKSAADFDTAIRKAGAIAGASAKELDDMKAAALDLGATSSKSAKEIAGAYSELAAKGYDANQVIAAMPGIVKAAEASGEDLALVADTVTSAINAFGMAAGDANKVADVMAMTSNKSAAGIMDLQYAFKYAAAPAAQLGISMEELAAATGLMVDAGLAGEQAGTTLRASLLRLVKPPKMAREALEKLGVSAVNQDGSFKNLNEIIGELQKGLEGMTDAQKAASLGAIFGTESVSGMMTLVAKGPEVLAEFTKALENSGGMAEKTAAQMKAGIGGALERLSGSIESLVISIGDQLVPYITKLADFLAKVVNKFNGLSDATKKFLVVGAALTALFALLIGPILIFIGLLPSIITWFGSVALMFGVTSKALAMLLLRFTLLTGGIIAIASALYIAYNEVEWFRNGVNAAWAWIVNATKALAAKTTEAFKEIAKVTQEATKAFISGIIPALESFRDKGISAFQKVSSVVAPILGGIVDKLKNFGGEAKEAIQKAMSLDFSGIAQVAAKFLPSLIGYLLGGIPRLVIIGVNIIKAIADGMGLTVPELMNKVVESITGVINSFVASLPKFLEMGVQLITGILNGILSQIPTFIGIITELVNTFTTALVTMLPKLTTAGTQILTTLVLGIAVALPQLITAAIEIFTTLLGAIIAALPTIIEAGITVLSALISGIVQALPLIIGAGISLLNALIDGIISILPLLIETALMLVMSVAQLLIQNLPVILDAGIQILMALIDGIVKILPLLIDTAIDLVFAIVTALIANLPAILNAGVQLVMALINGLIKILPMLITTAIKLAVSIIKAIIQHLPQILSAGAQLILALIKGLVSIIGELGSAAMKIGGKIIEVISKVDLLQVGKDIIRGLISGIGSMASAVWNKAKEIANGVGNAIKNALKIKSPSREMMKLGVYTGEGFANGIASMINSVKAVTGDMALAALPETPTLSLAYDTPSAASMSLGMQSSFEVSSKNDNSETNGLLRSIERKLTNLKVEMDGYEVGRIVEPHVDSLQASKYTTRARMGGLR